MASNLQADALPASPVERHRVELLARIIEQMSGALQAIADHLRNGKLPIVDARIEASLHALFAELAQSAASDGWPSPRRAAIRPE